MAEMRVAEIENAYRQMKAHGWGFASNGHGFGDPRADLTVIGPFKNGVIEALAVDADPVDAVRKALATVDTRGKM